VRALIDVGPSFVVLARERAGSDAARFERCVSTPLRRMLERGQADGAVRAGIESSWLAEALVASSSTCPRPAGPRRDDTIGVITSLFLDGAAPAR
jgi:hypothetical protein